MASTLGLPDFRYFQISPVHEHVLHVEINRPLRLNSFIAEMWLELRQLFDTLSVAPSVRSIVLSGSGERAFSTGLDVQSASQSGNFNHDFSDPRFDGARAATSIRRHNAEFQDCISAIERCEKPVICVMHGYTFGLGIDISTCADVRICSDDTQFAVKEVDVGMAADIGTLSRLPKVVGNYSWVKDIALTARVFGAKEAFRVGFVSDVYPQKNQAIEEGIKWASLVASKSPVAVQGTKEILNYSRDHTVQDGLRYTGVWNSAALMTRDVPTAIAASMKKKKPTFEKL